MSNSRDFFENKEIGDIFLSAMEFISKISEMSFSKDDAIDSLNSMFNEDHVERSKRNSGHFESRFAFEEMLTLLGLTTLHHLAAAIAASIHKAEKNERAIEPIGISWSRMDSQNPNFVPYVLLMQLTQHLNGSYLLLKQGIDSTSKITIRAAHEVLWVYVSILSDREKFQAFQAVNQDEIEDMVRSKAIWRKHFSTKHLLESLKKVDSTAEIYDVEKYFNQRGQIYEFYSKYTHPSFTFLADIENRSRFGLPEIRKGNIETIELSLQHINSVISQAMIYTFHCLDTFHAFDINSHVKNNDDIHWELYNILSKIYIHIELHFHKAYSERNTTEKI
ncbi:hypothetical protein [Bdellovibrio sp. HCB-110]|uniref:hypothetical protein n=1 Tax=Bdellovibrio sp. HCB-110 TaxID=3391182 RepID=UPI0039B3AD61